MYGKIKNVFIYVLCSLISGNCTDRTGGQFGYDHRLFRFSSHLPDHNCDILVVLEVSKENVSILSKVYHFMLFGEKKL